MTTVLLTHSPTALASYFGARALAGLKALGDVRLNSEQGELDPATLLALAQDCEIIVADRLAAGSGALFRALPKLVAFSRCAVDIRNIDVAAASEAGVLVTRASAGFMASVSEWVIGVMIDLSRHISAANAAYHQGVYDQGVCHQGAGHQGAGHQVAGHHGAMPAMGRELRGATLGVIGYGQIGRHLCRLALAFEMKVLVADPIAEVDDPSLTKVSLPALLSRADYVVCLAVASDDTENLMDAAAFGAMQPTAFFINASRGNLVDEDALAAALDAGRLAGCALDVGRAADQMPSPDLARHPRVIATPHIGGLTLPAVEHQALETVSQVARVLQGVIPPGAVNPVHATRLKARHPA